MPPFTIEYGTFWALRTADGLPPLCTPKVTVEFSEVETANIADLTTAMDLPDSSLIEQRFQGRRRCFIFRIDGRIAAYGWVTQGEEQVGEMERTFHLRDDEAYIWHCGTIPEDRQKGLYSALLSQIIYQLAGEEIPRIWIGASRLNKPSIQGIANAGFHRVFNATYRRLLFLTIMWFRESTYQLPALIPDGYRIMLSSHEKRIGPLAIGWYRK
jgi:hypothetical protein